MGRMGSGSFRCVLLCGVMSASIDGGGAELRYVS